MKTRFFLTVLFCGVAIAATLNPISGHAKESSPEELGIGSQAPSLDIEHWIQDGNGFFKPVKEFKPGNVYVVEFWATWCGPCIQSMPHLAELQEKYRGQKVQIVSVSDESVDEVEALLGQQNEQEGKTFADITAGYSLTTDPDRSVYTDYMDASKQEGIPTSFIVGKKGEIEWIGHPMELDEPLEAVVDDKWDREAFKARMDLEKDFQENMQRISMLAGESKYDEAIALADDQIASVKDEFINGQWVMLKNSLKLSAGKLDDEALEFYREQIKKMKGDAVSLGRFGFSLVGVIQEGGKAGPLVGDAISAIEGEIPDVKEEDLKPFLLHTIARLYEVDGKLDEAIQSQEKAIEASSDRQKQRMITFLDELKEKLDPPKDEDK